MKARVLIGTSTFARADPAPLRILEAAGFEPVLNPYGRKLTELELSRLLPGAVAILAGLEPLTRDVLARSELKVISRVGAGLTNVDLQAAKDLGISVRSTPDAPASAVAELTVGILIASLRNIPMMDRNFHAGRWTKQLGRQLENLPIALIGFGRIGRRVAQLLAPFRPRLLIVDPAIVDAPAGVEAVTLTVALREAAAICLHASGETEILGEAEFQQMRHGVFLLNAARGALVDEAALCAALDAGIVAGGWIDTFQREPYEGPLTKYEQLILTPHIGSASEECRRRMEMESVQNLLDALVGAPA